MEILATSKPLISIVMSTYNNAESLRITIQQLLNQVVGEPQLFEIIVINNNSSDDTAAVLESFLSTHIQYQHYFEGKQGLSNARNTGLAHAKGEYILFTDDDAEIYPGWLARYLNNIRTSNAECIFGGIEVIWDQPQPWWYDDRYKSYFAIIDYGNTSKDVTDKWTHFYGKNFCVKRDFLVGMGGFDPELGRKGTDLTGGEELMVLYKLLETNSRVVYFPDITVGHRLKPREYTEANIKKHYLSCAKEILSMASSQPVKKIAGRPIGLFKNQLIDLSTSTFQLLKNMVTGDRKNVFFQKLRFLRAVKIIGLWIKTS